MNTIAISQARNNLPTLVDEASEYLKRFVITVAGKAKAVILSLEELESIEETAKIMSTPGAYKKIMQGVHDAKKRKGTPLDKLTL